MTFKTIKSLWITFVVLLAATVILGMFSEGLEVINNKAVVSDIFVVGVFGSLFSFFTHRLFIWPPVLLLMLLLELVFVHTDSSSVRIKRILVLEWFVISVPFVVWAITQDYYAWFYFILVLGCAQYLRLKRDHPKVR